jgi:hypothetical protein
MKPQSTLFPKKLHVIEEEAIPKEIEEILSSEEEVPEELLVKKIRPPSPPELFNPFREGYNYNMLY